MALNGVKLRSRALNVVLGWHLQCSMPHIVLLAEQISNLRPMVHLQWAGVNSALSGVGVGVDSTPQRRSAVSWHLRLSGSLYNRPAGVESVTSR